MARIEIDFCDEQENTKILTLSWQVLETPAAQVWLELLTRQLQKEFSAAPRFTGFINSKKDEKFLLSKLQKAIDVINEDGQYKISDTAEKFDQAFANIIHYHFETLSRRFYISEEIKSQQSKEFLKAIGELNYCIHDLEAYHRNIEAKGDGMEDYTFAGVIVEFRDRERYDLPKEFEKYFQAFTNFGDIVLHYSQTGKTWIEAFLDKDEDVTSKGIVPLSVISCEFDILFGQSIEDANKENDFKKFLISKKQDPKDPSLRIGHIVVATLDPQIKRNFAGFKNTLVPYTQIKTIRVKR